MTKVVSRGDFARFLVARIDKIVREETPRDNNDTIGASMLGTGCDRSLFYIKEHPIKNPNPHRVYRIFDFGNAIEALTIEWLREAGLYVYDRNPKTHKQLDIVGENYTGHADGIISTLPVPISKGKVSSNNTYVLEIKSHKDSKFWDVVDLGIRENNFQHYAQLQIYIGHSHELMQQIGWIGCSVKLDKGIYVAVNKDTCEIYCEEVPFDAETFDNLSARARKIARASSPPPRIAPRPDLSPCKYCGYQIHCFNDKRPPKILL